MSFALVVGEAISRLAIARGATMTDERIGDVYLDALADLDPNLVRRACADLAKLPRAEFEPMMPSVGAIRVVCGDLAQTDAAEAAKRLLGPAPNRDRDEPTYYCPNCHDEPNGWRLYECRGSGPLAATLDRPYSPCGRAKTHGPHSFAERCACLPHNPVIREAKERMRAFRQKRDDEHGRRAR